MSRPKTKGATIGVQLPLALDAQVRALAREAGKSPGLWIERTVIAAIHGEPRCPHRKVTKGTSGVWRCACGAVSVDRGVHWRVV